MRKEHLHAALAVLAVWLVLTSPWVSMLRRIPVNAGFFDYAHVALGCIGLGLGVIYAFVVCRGQQFRWFFPWACGHSSAIGRDVAGILRGEVPSAEGPGLYGAIKGLLLIAMVVTGLTGAAWLLQQGTPAAVEWRAWHAVAAWGLIVTGALHVLAVASHLLELMRD